MAVPDPDRPEPALVPELSVRDATASRTFYCSLLGFSCLYDRPEEGFACLTLGMARLMIDQLGLGRDFDPGLIDLAPPYGRGVNLQIEVPDLAAILRRLEGAGWPLRLPPEDRWYRRGTVELGNRQVVVADPDGYLLRLFEDLGERPARA